MKITKEDIVILNNIAGISQSVVIHPGNVVRGISESESVIVYAETGINFPVICGIYNLPRFVSAISMFDLDKIKIEFDEENGEGKTVTLSDGSRSARYTLNNPKLIDQPPPTINMPSDSVDLSLPWETLQGILRASSALQLPAIRFKAENNKMTIEGYNPSDPTADLYVVDYGDTEYPDFSLSIRSELLKVLPMDYHVILSDKGITCFKSDKITYYIGTMTTAE